ncbi:alpha/beta hydrolase-fold protein [Chitinophaga sp. Hz27]|uniref:alpha/beta hydrolase-fold protein n=1 Tax=Chitinophaga sp. Hz27 TaxID=3347169 RepID=UPI0035E02802
MIKSNVPVLFFLFSLFFLCVGANTLLAQDQPSVKDSIYSIILREQRKIEIVLPKGFDPAKYEKYEVLYCLEGVATFARMEYNFLSSEGFIPNLILVGISNTIKNGVDMRDRDFTPTHTYGETGGADKFLGFLKLELLPYIQHRYPVKDSGHTLYGGSLSGLFVVYSFLKEPDLFTSYIAVEPSLWWDNFYVPKSADQLLAKFGQQQHTLWLAGRDGSPFHYMGVAAMDSVLAANKLPGLVWARQLYPNETHYSTQFKGLWDGLKFSYGGFYASKGGYITSRRIVIKPQRGLIVKDKPFDLICYNLADSPYIRYTTDGTAPTFSSPSLTGEKTRISLDKNTLLKLTSFSARPEYKKEDSAEFEAGQVIQPVAITKNMKPGGLAYNYYEGDWTTMPAVGKLTPKHYGVASDTFDLSKFPVETGYVLAMQGYIKIPQPGYYIFEMGGKNFRCLLNGKLILGDHIIPGIGESYMVPLNEGFYALRVEYLHTKGSDGPQPLYLKPGAEEDFPVPAKMLYRLE